MTDMALQLRGLRVSSEQGRVLVDVPLLEARPGEALGITGPSGAGKSTLLFALAGLAPRAQGQVLWGGQDLLAMSAAARAAFRAAHVGMIFQDHLLFEELGALENAAVQAGFAPRGRRAALRRAAADRLDGFGVITDAPDVSQFSGGERQRVAVARALAYGPQIVLADEPTASLDRGNAETLTATLLDEARTAGRCIVVVSHDAALLSAMDRVVTIDHGQVSMAGAA